MPSALERILALSANNTASAAYAAIEDEAGHLVLAALRDLEEALVLLAADEKPPPGKKQQAKDGGSTNQGGSGAKKPAKGSDSADDDEDDEDDEDDGPPWLKKKKKNKVKATALVEAAMVALAGLQAAEGDWVEMTAGPATGIALAGKEPYGNVVYADPGYQKDGKKRYPLDNERHVRSAWSYINQDDNAGQYSDVQLSSIKRKIKGAMSKYGIQVSSGSK